MKILKILPSKSGAEFMACIKNEELVKKEGGGGGGGSESAQLNTTFS